MSLSPLVRIGWHVISSLVSGGVAGGQVSKNDIGFDGNIAGILCFLSCLSLSAPLLPPHFQRLGMLGHHPRGDHPPLGVHPQHACLEMQTISYSQFFWRFGDCLPSVASLHPEESAAICCQRAKLGCKRITSD